MAVRASEQHGGVAAYLSPLKAFAGAFPGVSALCSH